MPKKHTSPKWIRKKRKELRMTQGQLAEALGVSKHSVYVWERDDGQAPAMVKLAMEEVARIKLERVNHAMQ